ncbi:MAG: DsbA family oxidoreductase [Leptospiraceae bacterium]|nr:DsbA family oxidoreductase [Leptospiraceae bacterium]MCK6382063.1 DsbA family oxidoreductase [Leptospiraceae bacterium]NUM41021.1 DsbA family oxidoreductase [Leptospiraceae bacterium]
METKMKVEVWSDVLCPFCYIGKRQYETALKNFKENSEVELIWKSYQLDPQAPEAAKENQVEYLSKRKGMSIAQVNSMLDSVTNYAKSVGLDYNLRGSVVVNSFKAHILIQFAKSKGLGDEVEEKLFYAYFTKNKDIADIANLIDIGKEIGLDESELKNIFSDDNFSYLVKSDLQEANQIGVTGVPFFVFNQKYAVSGAQKPEIFLEVLEKSYSEWKKENSNPKIQIVEGDSCDIDGKCN